MRRLTLYPLILGLVLALGMAPCRSQTENSTNPEPEDPSGNAGTVKSTVETGGSYNAYNGNASRSITDLQVPGAPGVYGLDFTRHWNSTDPMYSPYGQFGARPFGNGGWTHSWNWSATPDVKPLDCPEGGCEGEYLGSYIHSINIEYPDGRTARFSFTRTIPDAEDPEPITPDPYPATLTGKLGTDDHLGDIASNGDHFWLYLADGGSVRFQWFDPAGYRAIKVVDPHGLATELFYQNDAAGDRLWRVAGPDGRSIFLEYRSLGGHPAAVIGKVGWGVNPGSYFQTVEYDYTNYSLPDPENPSQIFIWYALTGVRYMDDINAGQLVQATYTYTKFATHDTTPLTPSPKGRGPLLTTADDPRFEGPMTRIRYVFRGAPATGGEPFCESVDPTPFPGSPSMMYAPFPVEKEISLDTGEVVSQLWIPCNGLPESGMRTEYRGAGGARIFQFGRKGGLEPGATWVEIPNGPDEWDPPEADPGPMSGPPGYNAGYEITRLTDFADNPNPLTMPTDFHHNRLVKPYRSFDARGTLTQYKYQTREYFEDYAVNGRVNEVRHRTPGDDTKRTYHWDNPPWRDAVHIPNPYHHWLFSQTDERNNTTTYARDSLMRVIQISYYHGPAQGDPIAVESFTYNHFNQVTSHTLPSGGVKYYDYNGSFLWREWNTVDTINEPTIYTPDSFGRVATAQNPRAAAAGSYSAVMEYNSRHQVTKVHYPSTGWSSDPTVIYEYDKYGRCTAITNERGYRSTYTYDHYGRCTSYTEPVNAPACGGSTVGSRTWEWVYDRILSDNETPRDASTHTSNKWRLQIEPAYNVGDDRRATVRNYDYNDRMVFEFIGAIVPGGGGQWNFAHGAFHQYEYDANGNKTKYIDPHGRVTDYAYDHRNRLITTTEVKRPDQDSQVTVTEYDATGNKTKVTFPDERFQEWRFHDPFGQPAQFFDERHNMTSLYYRWGPMKLTASVVTRRERDGDETEEEQLTAFWHDDLGRLTETVFPDESYEQSTYDLGQLKTWRTRKGALKAITGYDARGRETAHTWSDDTPGITRLWDDANRLVNLANSVSSIDYSYDQAGQVREEGTAIMGALGQSQSGRKEVSYCRYPNGEISRITYPNGLAVQRTYTARGQLESVNWSGGSVSYDYLPDGRVSELHYGNGVHTGFDYDLRGFTRVVHHQSPHGNISHRTYWRDNRDRIIGWRKSGGPGGGINENGRGDRYGYDDEGQLYLASYEVDNPEVGGTGAMRTDIFTYDKMGNRMGQNHVASRGLLEFKRRNNGLNQYGEWYSIIHHDDHWAPPNELEKANGVLMQEGWIGASFNALNQPIAIYSGSTPPGQFLWFGYDPLGRCVKRWLAPESEGGYAPGSPNPVATYLYYDGWNLVQEGTAADSPTLLYVHGGRVDEVVAQIKPPNNELRYLQYDARGHCTFQTNTSGQIEEQYEYDAFGLPYFYDGWDNPTTLANGQPGSLWGNRILFTGREYLSDMRIYDLRNRVYHPELGRFLQPDPIQFKAGDYNLYRYCHNDPVNKSDPMGLELEVVQSISRGTITVTDKDTGRTFTIKGSSGNNNLSDVGKSNLGPIPPGSYSIYERQGGMMGSRAWILDRNDSVKGNDTIDDGATKDGKGRFALRYHKEVAGAPNKGSQGCSVCDESGIDRFGKAADKTSKGPSRRITSPATHPGDGKPPDDFGDQPRIGTWKVRK